MTTNGGHPCSEDIMAYYDGELLEPDVLNHIESCSICREKAAKLKQLDDILRIHITPITASDSFSMNVMNQIKTSSRRMKVARYLLLSSATAAVVAAILVFIVPVVFQTKEETVIPERIPALIKNSESSEIVSYFSSLDPEEKETVKNLSLLEDMETLEVIDAAENVSAIEAMASFDSEEDIEK